MVEIKELFDLDKTIAAGLFEGKKYPWEALAEIGVNVYWHTVVGDNPARLTECLYRARNRADLIVTTGCGNLNLLCDRLVGKRSF